MSARQHVCAVSPRRCLSLDSCLPRVRSAASDREEPHHEREHADGEQDRGLEDELTSARESGEQTSSGLGSRAVSGEVARGSLARDVVVRALREGGTRSRHRRRGAGSRRRRGDVGSRRCRRSRRAALALLQLRHLRMRRVCVWDTGSSRCQCDGASQRSDATERLTNTSETIDSRATHASHPPSPFHSSRLLSSALTCVVSPTLNVGLVVVVVARLGCQCRCSSTLTGQSADAETSHGDTYMKGGRGEQRGRV